MVFSDERYIFSVLSDGAGSSKFAKEASECVVSSAVEFCSLCAEELFQNTKIIAKELVCFIQKRLFTIAIELNTDISQMMATYVLLGLDKDKKRFFTIHIGDGIIMRNSNNNCEIISGPENGISKKYTYFVNSASVMKHLRISIGDYKEGDTFLSSTDGLYEHYLEKHELKKLVEDIEKNKIDIDFVDDVSYTQIKV